MVYFVIECQSNGSTGTTIVNTYQTRDEAESKFHLILSAAAVSSVMKHGAILFSDNMAEIMTKVYDHPVEVVEENEEESNG